MFTALKLNDNKYLYTKTHTIVKPIYLSLSAKHLKVVEIKIHFIFAVHLNYSIIIIVFCHIY